LVSEILGAHYHLILGALRHTNSEFATRIRLVLPAKFLLSGAANAEVHTWEGKRLIGEDSAADQEVIRMAVFLPAFCG